MSWNEIDFTVLKQVVALQHRTFSTKDVSTHAKMRQEHAVLAQHGHYHAFVGRSLSENHVALGIMEIRKSASRGSVWEKNGLANNTAPTATAAPAVASPSKPTSSDLGPQCSKDPPFKARMRFHQSWYRANVMRVPFGTGPKTADTSFYGNMLSRADGEAGRNFLTPEIAQVARDRVAQSGDKVESFRLFHNMLSSQPMCFNLFGPLVHDRALACRLISPLLSDNVAEVTRVAIEWAPEPRANYLNDNTSFDAFIEYRTADGSLYGLGVETKLTEPFSQREYDGERYRRWMRVPTAPWRAEAQETVHQIEHNQLWRDHLLTVALRHQPSSPYAKVRLMVIRHPEDSECASVVAEYRKLLREDDDTLMDMPLNRLVDVWTSLLRESSQRTWIEEFHTRYLELERSGTHST